MIQCIQSKIETEAGVFDKIVSASAKSFIERSILRKVAKAMIFSTGFVYICQKHFKGSSYCLKNTVKPKTTPQKKICCLFLY